MDVTRFLGTHRYTWLMELGRGEGCAWHLMRREMDGARFLAQLWSPLPSDRDLEQMRDTFLARFLDAEALDPVVSHLGYDGGQAWYLQALHGTPVSRLWTGWGEEQREALMHHLQERLAQDPHPRCLHPEVITFRPGLTQIPRVLGPIPWGLADLPGFLTPTAPAPALSEDLPWHHPRDLSGPISRPFRGRSQELPYLKSLMLGFNAPIPMERIVLLQGEEGLGKEHLAAWACAVAESEGIWVHHLAASADESAGRFLGRLVEALLLGSEVDLYAERPGAAKALSLRVQAFSFLTGGRNLNRLESGPEPEEIKAALEALDFAGLIHPRLIHLSGLDRATPEVLALIRELVHASSVPWLLSLTTGALGAGLRPLIAQLKGESSAAVVGVNRLEDDDLGLVLEDLLGRHDLPKAFRADLITQSLGNPGLLRNFLELAQQSGALAWELGSWVLVPGQSTTLKAEDDLMRQIFLGRLQRLTPASAALVRLLALAERPLPTGALGRLLGLHDDALEDALQGAQNSRLVQIQRGQALIPEPRWRELVLAHTPQPELKRLARALVAILQEQGVACPVILQSLASDEATALAAMLATIDKAPPGPPHEVAQAVNQALHLKPSPWEEARLHEHLADAWAFGPLTTQSQLSPLESVESPEHTPTEQALDALGRALTALTRAPQNEDIRLAEARLLRKRAMMHLHLRHPGEAQEALTAAATRLADHPLHPEQPRLRLALGQLHLLQGHLTKGIRALEEGLQSQSGFKPLPQDQAALLLVLGRALAGQSQFLRAASLLQSAHRLLEHAQDFRHLVPVQIALAQVRMAQGQSEICIGLLREALQTARMQSDLALQAQGHLALGMVRSLQQFLGPALSHLDRALTRAQRLGDKAQLSLVLIWRARTLAALGDIVAADHAQFQALAAQPPLMSPEERGDHLVLQGDVARFRGAWRDTARLYKAAADHYESTGLLWRQRLALLRFSQAAAREALQANLEAPEQSWAILENLKGPVEGSGSRWLDLEWHRAHALMLSTVPATESVVQESMQAWSEVQAAARDLQFPAQILEASMEGAQLLLARGERLGARSRMQDAFPSFQQLWARLPENQGPTFLGRMDMHRFRQTVEAVGLRFVLPERADPLVDWAPTQLNLPAPPEPE
jgi:tetratricopeptide (TPR) repeat protein